MRELSLDKIFTIKDSTHFRITALEQFTYQSEKNTVYNNFIRALGKDRKKIKNLSDIPFLPIEFFRSHNIITGDLPIQIVFTSSSTTGSIPGKHFVSDLRLYEKSLLETFTLFYGDPSGYLICALLPSYTERKGSSLVYMAEQLIRSSNNKNSGFYKEKTEDLIRVIKYAKARNQKTLLLGVSFALLDLAEERSPDLEGIIVMETGGMKGRRKELTRKELHGILKEKLNVPSIHSEYGMTELLSQAYSKSDGIFYSPPWMKVMIRDIHDPLSVFSEPGRVGGINIIDLANINSCSFIATGDMGKLHADGGFEVLGRLDNSDIRGCNLMVD